MQKILHTIRSRSLRERQRIVYGSAFVITLVICGIWLSLLKFDNHKQAGSSSTNTKFAPLKSLTSGLKGVWSSAKYSTSRDSVESPKQDVSKENVTDKSSGESEVQQYSEGSIILEPQPVEVDSSTPKNDSTIVQ